LIRYKVWEYDNRREDLDVTFAIPCHIRDIPLLSKYCLPSINKLNPKPSRLVVAFNDGINLEHENALKFIRIQLFDKVFKDYDTDVLFSYGADGYFKEKIVTHADPDIVVSVNWLPLRPITIITNLLMYYIIRKGWHGSYFMPRDVWFNTCRSKFDGTDTSIKMALDGNYKIIKWPQVWQVRLNRQRYLDNIFNGYGGKNFSQPKKMIRLLRMVDF
jgi:hypothetical protein